MNSVKPPSLLCLGDARPQAQHASLVPPFGRAKGALSEQEESSEVSSYWDRVKNPRCQLCPLHEEAARVCAVTGKGNLNARVLFVGEAPGEEEEKRGLPFVGRSGQFFLDILEEADWSIPFAMTNAAWCRPKDNRTPKVSEWRTCAEHHLHPAIVRMAPRMIVCLGAVAARAVLADSSASVKKYRRRVATIERQLRNRKFPHHKKRRKIKVVVTYHPAATFRTPSLKSVLVEDLRHFQRVLAGEKMVEDPEDRTYILQMEGEDLGMDYATKAGRRLSMALDLETNTYSPWDPEARILCAAVSRAPLHATAFTLGKNRATKVFHKWLRDKFVTKVGHNVKFDLVWLKKNGYAFRGPVFDTMVAFHLLAEEYPDKSLEHLAARFTPMGHYADGMKEKRGEFEVVDEALLDYCAKDADAAGRLRKLFANQIRSQRLKRPMRLAMRTLKTLVDVEVAGMMVDEEQLDLMSDKYRKSRYKVRKWFHKQFPGVNLQSPKQIAEVLFDRMELKPVKFTPTRLRSVDDSVLQRLLEVLGETDDRRTVVRKLVRHRELTKVETSFLGPIRDKHLKWDGCVHPTFNLATVVTGRLSCSNPNLQQIPEDVRSIFISRWTDGVVVEADFSQIELRVLADCAEEKAMLDVFDSGGDIHTATASRVYGVGMERVTKEQRYHAKTVNFGILYGMSAGRLKQETGMDYQEAEAFLKDYWSAYPKVREWVRKIRRQVILHGYVRSLFGRKRRLPILDPESKEGQHQLRQAVNFPIQSDAAGLTMVAMNSLHYFLRGMKTEIVGTVHDSILLDCPREEVDEVVMLADEVCSRPDTRQYGFEMEVPLKVDIGAGPNWRDLKKVN